MNPTNKKLPTQKVVIDRDRITSGSREILIADESIKDLHILLEGINPGVDMWLAKPGKGIIGQIIKALNTPYLKTLHILAHGAPGQISIGDHIITAVDFRSRFDGAAVRDFDIAFWSCNAGAGDAGQSFVEAVAETTGARVVAAKGLVGSAEKGGSWKLNSIQAPFSKQAQNSFRDVLKAKVVTDTADNLAKGIGWSKGDTLIINNGARNNSATMAQLNLIRLGTNASPKGAPAALASATVTDTTIDSAGDLKKLDIITKGKLVATLATKIIGSDADLATIISATSIDTSATVAVTVTGAATVVNLNIIDTNTSGVVTASVSGTAATLLGLTGTGNDYTITVTGLVTVTNLNTIDNKTIGNVTASVSGAASYLLGLNGSKNAYTLTVTDKTVTATDLTTLVEKTTIDIIATAANTLTGDAQIISALLDNIQFNNNIAVRVTSNTATGADLNNIESITSNVIDAFSVRELTGQAQDIAGAISSEQINTLPDVAVILGEESVSASDLITIDDCTTTVIDGVSVIEIFGTLEDIKIAFLSVEIDLSTSFAITVDDTDFVSVDDLWLFTDFTSGVITAHVSPGDMATLLTFEPADPDVANNLYFTVTDDSVSATDLLKLMSETTVNIDATAVLTMTGPAADIASVLGSGLVDTIVSLNVIVDADTVVAVDLLTIAADLGTGTLDASQITELTGSLADIESVIASTNITFAPAEDPTALAGFAITVDDTDFVSVDDLNIFTAINSGVITAHVSPGDMATLLTFEPADPDVANNLYFTITDESVSATDLLTLMSETTVNIDATAVSTMTGPAADIASVLDSGLVDTIVFLNVIVDPDTVVATDLLSIQSYLGIGSIDASQITELTGSLADIESVISSSNITFAPADAEDPSALPAFAITVDETDFVTVDDLNLFAAATSGVIAAHVSTGDMATLLTFTPADPNVPNNLYFTITDESVSATDLLTLMSETTVNIDATAVSTMTGPAADIASVLDSGLVDTIVFLNAILNAGFANADDLNMIDEYLPLGTLDARALTEITGLVADIEKAISSDGIAFGSDYSVTVSDYATVDELNIIDSATTGVITAFVTEGDISTLLTLTGTDNSYYISITDESANAGNLLTLDAKTTIAIDATNVYTFTGTAADLANVMTSDTINHLTVGVTSIVDAGEASASDLFTIDDNSILPVDATAVTTISGAIADIETDIASDGISFSSSYNVNVTDTGDLGTLITFATSGALTVGSGSSSAVTVNLGASGFSTIHLGGSGDHLIIAATTVTETFILDAAQNGGSQINNLTFGDGINIDGENAITALTGGSQVIGDINTAGEWGFDASTNVLSYYNDSQGQVDSITLTGVTSVELQAGGNLFTIAGLV